jgi:hypothetical protein
VLPVAAAAGLGAFMGPRRKPRPSDLERDLPDWTTNIADWRKDPPDIDSYM